MTAALLIVTIWVIGGSVVALFLASVARCGMHDHMARREQRQASRKPTQRENTVKRLIGIGLALALITAPIAAWAANQTGHGTNGNSGSGVSGSTGNQGGGAGNSGGNGNAGGSNGGGSNGGGGNNGDGGGHSGGGSPAASGGDGGSASGGGSSHGVTSGGFAGPSSSPYVHQTSPKRDDAAREKTEQALKECHTTLIWSGTRQDGSFWFSGYEFEYPGFAQCMKERGYSFQFNDPSIRTWNNFGLSGNTPRPRP